MPALLIAQARPRNVEKLIAYSAAAASVVAAFGGELLHRGKLDGILAGTAEDTPHGLVIIRFPDIETARNWYNSADYQALLPLRDEGADMTFSLYETA